MYVHHMNDSVPVCSMSGYPMNSHLTRVYIYPSRYLVSPKVEKRYHNALRASVTVFVTWIRQLPILVFGR